MNVLRTALRSLGGRGEVRLALVVRKDAQLTSGDLTSHCAEAAINAYKLAGVEAPELMRVWDSTGMAKVVLRAKDSNEIETLRQKAKDLNVLTSCSFHRGGTDPTVVGFGPMHRETLDLVTGDLKLL